MTTVPQILNYFLSFLTGIEELCVFLCCFVKGS